jgi:uncharacterized protein (TIGR02452 family)
MGRGVQGTSVRAAPAAAAAWDAAEWSTQFDVAVNTLNHGRIHTLRQEVFTSTLAIIRQRHYEVDGAAVRLENFNEQQGTRFYAGTESDALCVPLHMRGQFTTSITVVNSDCLEAARDLMDKHADGSVVAVLNMANRHTPGGGVLRGAGAQEENIFRRSTLLCSLYPLARFAGEYKDIVPPSAEGPKYPIEHRSGGIYSPPTQVFRESEAKGYALLPSPFSVAFLTVPAIMWEDRPLPLSNDRKRAMLLKIRAIFRIAAAHGHLDLVLSAFGCGAFGNPPKDVAALFHAALREPEFVGVFRRVEFAILDDHNAMKQHNLEGNLVPFQTQFACQDATLPP